MAGEGRSGGPRHSLEADAECARETTTHAVDRAPSAALRTPGQAGQRDRAHVAERRQSRGRQSPVGGRGVVVGASEDRPRAGPRQQQQQKRREKV